MLSGILKRLAVAGVAIPTVLLCVVFPVPCLVLLTIVLSFVGMKEFVLIRSQILDPSKFKDEHVQEHPFPPTQGMDTRQILIRSLLAVFLDLAGLFCSASIALQASPSMQDVNFNPFSYLFQVHSAFTFFLFSVIVLIILFCFSMFDILHSGTANRKQDAAHLQVNDLLAVMLDFFGVIWVGGGCALGLLLARMHKTYLCLILLCNWAADGMALAFGKNLGKHKLNVKLSPNKTMEGGIGAIVGATGAALIVRFIYLYGQENAFLRKIQLADASFQIPSAAQFAVLGVILGILAIVGDLCKSWFKRLAKVKDSGDFFQAHGGVLDRIDGLLFSFPIMYFLLVLGVF